MQNHNEGGKIRMEIRYFLNGEEITEKEADKKFGEERMNERLEDAMESYFEDPMTLNTWMDGLEIRISR